MSRPWRCVPRLVALMTLRAGAGAEEVAGRLRACAAGIGALAGAGGGSVRVAMKLPEDPLSRMLEQRGRPAPLDAVLEVTLAQDQPLAALIACSRRLGSEIGSLVDAEASAALAGLAHLIVEGDGPIFLALAARRDPATTVEEMRRWWLEQHAVLVRRVVAPFPDGYEQLHVERALSRQAAEAAGFGPEEYDAFDSINARSVDELLRPLLDPAVAGRLYRDELGHMDHGSFRGAVCRVL